MTPTPTSIDMNTFLASLARERAEREQRNLRERAALLALLRGQGVAEVAAQYDGYGDSGNVEDIQMTPAAPALDAGVEERLRDFLWSMAYALHPGFENNDGADGEITWDLASDKMTIDHRERFTDYNHYLHEGI